MELDRRGLAVRQTGNPIIETKSDLVLLFRVRSPEHGDSFLLLRMPFHVWGGEIPAGGHHGRMKDAVGIWHGCVRQRWTR